MRLIDADELIEHMHRARVDTRERIEKLIMVQPTIEEYKPDEWCYDCKEYDKARHYCPRFNRVIRETAIAYKRKHGYTGKWMEYDRCHIQCPLCRRVWADFENEVEYFNYCPNCGAKMIKDGS